MVSLYLWFTLPQVLYYVNVSSEKRYFSSMGWVINAHKYKISSVDSQVTNNDCSLTFAIIAILAADVIVHVVAMLTIDLSPIFNAA